MSFKDIIEASQEEEAFLEEQFSAVKYTGEACSNCGRERVELLVNGKKVCEKCNWDQDANDYCRRELTLDEELKRDGFDGLFCSEGECACEIGDLHPCGEYSEECKPGYKKTYEELSEDMKEQYQEFKDGWFIVRDK